MREGWRIVSLASLAERDGLFVDGDWIESKDQSADGTLRILQVGNVLRGGIRWSGTERWITEETASRLGCTRIQNGDILIARMPDPIGRAGLVTEMPTPAVTAVDCAILRLGNVGVDREYLVQALNTDTHLATVAAHVTGTTRQRISRSNLGALTVALPPLDEQRRIAAVLSAIDAEARATEHVADALERLFRATRDRMFAGFDRADSTVLTISELADASPNSLTLGPFGSDLVATDYRPAGAPVVFVRDVKANAFRWKSNVFVEPTKAAALDAHRVEPGDIVITKMGLPAGLAAVYPDSMPRGIVTADIIRLRPKLSVVDPRWLSYALNAPEVSQQVATITGGQTRPKLTLRDYRQLRLLVPPLREQRACAAALDAIMRNRSAHIDEREATLSVKSATARSLLAEGLE